MNRNYTNIALVDDHPIVGIGVKAMLEKLPNFQFCQHAFTGQDILTHLAHHKTDLLLLDLNLPDIEYAPLVRRIKSIAPSMKICAYTAYNETALVKAVLRLGVDGYLLKTTSPDEFRQALQTILNHDEVCIGRNVNLTEPKLPKKPVLKDNFQKCISLSKREKEILSLISQGQTSQAISQNLYISKHTVETHRKNILRKLNFTTSTELVKFAVQQGLV
ncbi:MAG: response regulator transcription factor [Saprospiraceae bacterium]|nr:response regulator transcription factor [Saprospiraceae bacterium]